MPKGSPPAAFRTVLAELLSWFKAAKAKGLIIGGIATSLLARPRTTQDIDALVLLEEERWAQFVKLAKNYGFAPRHGDVLAFAGQHRVMLFRHTDTEIDVDISFGALPFEIESLRRTMYKKVGGLSLPLPTPEDLIIMKAVAHRPQDAIDIQAILETHPSLNLRRVRRWVREFARVLEVPEIYRDCEALIKGKRRSG